ncbi:MAG: beta-lactamase family protein [Bryobacterales bacterium]|nr:beta-lactamase family protein [Bryobacterales bacterium]
MTQRLTRRGFTAAMLTAAQAATARTSLDATLRAGIERRGIPCATAVVADSRRILYEGAFGTRDAESRMAVKPDAIFAIASMTKAITSIAALQLVEQKKVSLEEPAERFLPELRGRMVLDGFGTDGRAQLRPPARPVTLRHLLTHTSGLCYALWDKQARQWENSPSAKEPPGVRAPLMFDPGTRWQYGQGIDAAGRLVEAVSGMTLEAYFQQHILGPLGMRDTSFILPAEKFERAVTRYQREPDGAWKPAVRRVPTPPTSFNGGGGLFSTAPDYIRFAQAILRGGRELLQDPATFRLAMTNQTGRIRAGVLKSTDPVTSADVDTHPGASDRHTLAFVMNPQPHRGGRAAGSLTWAGINNTFYWIDPKRGRCAVLMMQFLPFVDREAVGLLGEFERAVYANL